MGKAGCQVSGVFGAEEKACKEGGCHEDKEGRDEGGEAEEGKEEAHNS